MPVARYQPQGKFSLSPLAKGAVAVIAAGNLTNIVTGKPLTPVVAYSVPAYAGARGVAGGVAFPFRRNMSYYTETLPTIGTQSFVTFWVGYPEGGHTVRGSGDGSANTVDQPAFLVGSDAARTGIYQGKSTHWGGTYDAESWGTVRAWGDDMPVAQDILTPWKFTALAVIRRQSSIDFWRDGRLVRSVAVAANAIGPDSLFIGSYVAESYWMSASDTMLAGRIMGEWTAAQAREFTTNPWALFQDTEQEAHDEVRVAVTTGYADTSGSSVGGSNVTAVARAIAQAYGTSINIGSANATAQALVSASGAAAGTSDASNTARSVFQIVGAAQGSSAANIPAFTVTQTFGTTTGLSTASAQANTVAQVSGGAQGVGSASGTARSVAQAQGSTTGSSTAQSSVQVVTCVSGSSQGTATLVGNAACVWQVAGSAKGVAAVAGYSDASTARVFFDTQGVSYGTSSATASAKAMANASGNASGVGTAAAKANAVSNAAGSATGSSFVVANGQTLISAIGAALGVSSASGNGVAVISATGQAVAASLAGASANAVKGTSGSAVGSSSAQSATIAIYESVARSLSTSVVQGVVQQVINAIGKAQGYATVSGTTEGGVHYTASGDKLTITVTFAPYTINTVESAPYNIQFKDR